jgi:hypothetical protein
VTLCLLLQHRSKARLLLLVLPLVLLQGVAQQHTGYVQDRLEHVGLRGTW